jgi:CBS domain-containing protein
MTSETWGSSSDARRVRIYVSEEDKIGSVPAQHAVVTFLRRNNAAGMTIIRGFEGFGASGRMHTSRLAEVPWDLPVVIEWVDTPARVDELLPQLKRMIPAGLITIDRTEVILFATRTIRTVSEAIPVEAVMTKDVVTVRRDTPIHDVVDRMRKHSLRAVPVVDDGIVVGMITNSDLVSRAHLGVRLTLLPSLPPAEQAKQLESLPRRTADEIMSAPPVVVAMNAPLSEAAETMVRRRLKRLPVVDDRGALVGILSRVDLLRTVADFGTTDRRDRPAIGLNGDAPVSTIMREDVPTVHADSPLNEVVQAVVSTRLNRALVVDADRRVLGVVRARSVLERVTPSLRTNLLRSLMQRLPFLRPSADEREIERHAAAHSARDLMDDDVLTVGPNERVRDVVAKMVEGGRKLVAIVDERGCLLGVVDRADMLRGIIEEHE